YEEVFKIDQLRIVEDHLIGRLLKGKEDVQSKAVLTPSALLRGAHDASARPCDHHEAGLDHTPCKSLSQPIGRSARQGPRGAKYGDLADIAVAREHAQSIAQFTHCTVHDFQIPALESP